MNIDLTEEENIFLRNMLLADLEKKLRSDYGDLEEEDLLNLDSTEFKFPLKKFKMIKNIIKKLDVER
jgi:hypothetical protein